MFNFGGFDTQDVDNTSFYVRLGIDSDSSPSVIKKAYYKLAKDCHPDKFPDDEIKLQQFQELSHAYEVLSDPEKRELYDQYGEEGLQRGGGASSFSSIFDILSGNNRRSRGPRKGEPVGYGLPVTLKELYSGCVKEFSFTKRVLCEPCKGSGSTKQGSVKTCRGCGGHGAKLVQRRMGFNIVQMQVACDDCNGSGEMVDPKFICKACNGAKTKEEDNILKVEIDKGMKDGEKITFTSEGDQEPGIIPGDIIIVLKEKPSDEFTRRGNDLIKEVEISLIEALTGFEFIIKHLDGRSLLVKSKPGDIIKQDDIKAIPDEGMPQHRNPFLKGFLFVHFTIKWPEPGTITLDNIKLLEQVFGEPKKSLELPTEYETVTLDEYNENIHESSNNHQNYEAYDDDSDGEPSVGCRQQ